MNEALIATLAKRITAFQRDWMVWRFNGDFNYIDWKQSEFTLKQFIKEQLDEISKTQG